MTEFKLIVAGGRDFHDYVVLSEKLKNLATIGYVERAISIVSGMARGADALGVRFAKEHNVKLYEFPADWNQGRGAGFKRNEQMGRFADGLLAFWDGESRGTAHMINFMKSLNKPVHTIKYSKPFLKAGPDVGDGP